MNYKNTVFKQNAQANEVYQHNRSTQPAKQAIRTQDTRITQLTLQRASQLLSVMQTRNQKEGKCGHVFEVNLPCTQGSTGSYHQFL